MMVFSELREEFIEEVLVRLPVKSLVRLGAVCKSWNSLIASSTFIQAHLRHSSSHNPLLLVIYISGEARPMPDRQSLSLHWDNPPFHVYNNHKLMNHPFVMDALLYGRKCNDYDPDHHDEHINVVTICDGLVCLSCPYCNSVIIWNPCIRKYVTLPKLNTELMEDRCYDKYCRYGFGYDWRTNDYKVVAVVGYRDGRDEPASAVVWSLRKPFWSNKLSADQFPMDSSYSLDCLSSHDVLVHGALHWCFSKNNTKEEVEKEYCILSFDLSNEQFGVINMPQLDRDWSNWNIFRYKNSLAFFVVLEIIECTEIIEMWIMKEYGNVESWSKLCTVHFPGVFWLFMQGFRNNGEIMFNVHGGELENNNKWLNPKKKDIREFQIDMDGFEYKDCSFVEPFVASLVLLDQLNAISS